MPENTAEKQRGRGPGKPFEPGKSGNPAGRPRGARNQSTLAAEALLDGEAETITRKAIERAHEGDPWAVRLCLERLLPPRRDRPVNFLLPTLQGPADAADASSALLAAVASGELTPSEAAELGKLVEGYVRSIEAVNFEARLSALEKQQDRS